jgi:hypothetical protein
MKHFFIYLVGVSLFLGACSPRITTQINKNYSPLDYKEDIVVFKLEDPIPDQSEELGTVRIGDTGFSTKCGYEVVIDAAKLEARKAGGNALKITEHTLPNFVSSCHQITATILKVTDFSSLSQISEKDSLLANADYALLHVYRFSGAGALVGFDLYLGDSVICRVKNNWKKTIRIRKDGLNTLWARTEVKEELPINIKIGKEYYIRCGITMGALVGRPSIQLVSKDTGESEYRAIKLSKSEMPDRLYLNDGREVECRIINEDDTTIYFSTKINDKVINTQISKQQVQEIQKGE